MLWGILLTIITVITVVASSDECGISPSYQRYSRIFDGDLGITQRIIGGDESEEGQWPWVCNLSNSCTASIIHKKWIITAAHCLRGDGYSVFVGSMDKKKQIEYKARRWYPHETDDIGLVELEDELEFSELVKPVCLSRTLKLEPHEVVAALGWGGVFEYFHNSTRDMEYTYPDILNERHFAISKEIYASSDPKKIHLIGLNAGVIYGDSGGPLLARRNGKWYIVGELTGNSTDKITRIDIRENIDYADVRQYCDWIENITSGEVKCDDTVDANASETTPEPDISRIKGI